MNSNAFWVAATALIPADVLANRQGRATMRLLGVNASTVRSVRWSSESEQNARSTLVACLHSLSFEPLGSKSFDCASEPHFCLFFCSLGGARPWRGALKPKVLLSATRPSSLPPPSPLGLSPSPVFLRVLSLNCVLCARVSWLSSRFYFLFFNPHSAPSPSHPAHGSTPLTTRQAAMLAAPFLAFY